MDGTTHGGRNVGTHLSGAQVYGPTSTPGLKDVSLRTSPFGNRGVEWCVTKGPVLSITSDLGG